MSTELEFVAAVLKNLCTTEEIFDLAGRCDKMASDHMNEAEVSSDSIAMVNIASAMKWNRLAFLLNGN